MTCLGSEAVFHAIPLTGVVVPVRKDNGALSVDESAANTGWAYCAKLKVEQEKGNAIAHHRGSLDVENR